MNEQKRPRQNKEIKEKDGGRRLNMNAYVSIFRQYVSISDKRRVWI